MRKMIVAVVISMLMILATAVPAFAFIDGPPFEAPGCQISSAVRSGSIGQPGTGTPLICFDHP